jgi:hypothetical protein
MWNLEGMTVKATYLSDIPVTGKVVLSRVQYGGEVCHHIEVTEAFNAGRGISREVGGVVIVDHKFINQVME